MAGTDATTCPACGADVSAVVAEAQRARAAAAGATTSRAKAEAARRNGHKGGRPRKAATHTP